MSQFASTNRQQIVEHPPYDGRLSQVQGPNPGHPLIEQAGGGPQPEQLVGVHICGPWIKKWMSMILVDVHDFIEDFAGPAAVDKRSLYRGR